MMKATTGRFVSEILVSTLQGGKLISLEYWVAVSATAISYPFNEMGDRTSQNALFAWFWMSKVLGLQRW